MNRAYGIDSSNNNNNNNGGPLPPQPPRSSFFAKITSVFFGTVTIVSGISATVDNEYTRPIRAYAGGEKILVGIAIFSALLSAAFYSAYVYRENKTPPPPPPSDGSGSASISLNGNKKKNERKRESAHGVDGKNLNAKVSLLMRQGSMPVISLSPSPDNTSSSSISHGDGITQLSSDWQTPAGPSTSGNSSTFYIAGTADVRKELFPNSHLSEKDGDDQ